MARKSNNTVSFLFSVTGRFDNHVQAYRFNQALPYWNDLSKVEILHLTLDSRPEISIMAQNVLASR